VSDSQYASGKNAFGFCDRCDFRVKLSKMRKLVINEKQTNIKVCPACWEPDQPQYRIGRIDQNDPQALRDPRPDTSLTNSR
jgi:hypothetical protein